MNNSAKPDMWGLSFIAIFGMVWNFLGIIAFIIAMMVTRESLAASGTSAEQIDYVFETPLFAKLANAVGVFIGFAGALALYLRKRLAYYLFTLSLLAIMLLMIDTILRNGFSYLGPVNNAIYLAVMLIGLTLFWIAYKCNIDGVLD